jgi:competence protein ComEC
MRLGAWLDPSLAGRDQIIDGVVSGLPDAAPHGTRFLFTVESGASGGVATGDRHEGWRHCQQRHCRPGYC